MSPAAHVRTASGTGRERRSRPQGRDARLAHCRPARVSSTRVARLFQVTFRKDGRYVGSQWLIRNKLISSVPWDDAGNYVRFSATFVARGGREAEEKVLAEFARRLSDAEFTF